jgi:arginyl-tRNA synthetase
MKKMIQQQIQSVLKQYFAEYPEALQIEIPIEHTRIAEHGDFSTSIALSLAKRLHKKPYEFAQQIANHLTPTIDNNPVLFSKIEVVQPGFINFFIHPDAWRNTLANVLNEGDYYGHSSIGNQARILIEYVSSNPTGPLHVGHGRAAAHGDIVVRLLRALNYQVHAEYYINDAGRQMDILSCSIWLRYLALCGEHLPYFPSNAYQGHYIHTIAQALKELYGNQLHLPFAGDLATLFEEKITPENKEKWMDKLIEHTKTLLGEEAYSKVSNFGLKTILEDMRADLAEFGVHFDQWFSEKSLISDGSLDETIEILKAKGHTYELEGSLWFRSTQFGDDKDRVLIRANGQPTYFAVDAAYRFNIFKKRGFPKIINFLGADHHGYLARIHAVIEALGYSRKNLAFSTLQLVSLYREDKKLPLSTRSGEFITLRQLREEVGNDAARLFFVLRKSGQTLDFDLTLAKSHSHQNPVYYLQYAHARICSVMRQLQAKGLNWNVQEGLQQINTLGSAEELELIKHLERYPDAVLQAGMQYEPYLLVHYLRELARQFHSYYNHTPVLVNDSALRSGRLTLIQAVKQVLYNGFTLLGIEALAVM